MPLPYAGAKRAISSACLGTVRRFSSVANAALTMSPAAKHLFAMNPNLSLESILASGRSPSHKHVITKVICTENQNQIKAVVNTISHHLIQQGDVLAALAAPLKGARPAAEIKPLSNSSTPLAGSNTSPLVTGVDDKSQMKSSACMLLLYAPSVKLFVGQRRLSAGFVAMP
jgi:hypothetical protein